ncbi:MAG TPA: pilus assembly protein PilM, partial [Pirellulaceae bacterium]|nr:pilus assembly protein PilM [Pirellulaceae bacterium]
LQGLGLAQIEADLTPQEKGGMLGMLPGISFGRKAGNMAWGLDLSDFALKAIKLSRRGKTEEVQIEACEYILHSTPLTHPEVDQEKPQIIEETLQDFVGRAGELKGVKVCIGFPGQRVLGRFFELPPMPAKKVNGSIQYEAVHQLPVSLEELCWSHQILDPSNGRIADDQPRRVLIQAARDAHVRDRVATFKLAGITADFVQSDCIALHNALVHELFADTDPSLNAEAITAIDVGTESTNIVVSSPACVWFRTVTQGGESFTRELVKQLKLTHEQAEQLQRNPAKARRFSQLQAAIEPLFVQLASEIDRSLTTYAKLYPDHPIQQAYGLGGGFQMHGLLRFLRSGK